MDNYTQAQMSNEQIFESKAEFNKWLKELTASERELIIEMLNEARHEGFTEGHECAIDENGL